MWHTYSIMYVELVGTAYSVLIWSTINKIRMIKHTFYKDKLLVWMNKSPTERHTSFKLFLVQERSSQMNALMTKTKTQTAVWSQLQIIEKHTCILYFYSGWLRSLKDNYSSIAEQTRISGDVEKENVMKKIYPLHKKNPFRIVPHFFILRLFSTS